MAPFWNALYDYNADLVLNGHDHAYERFARQNASAVADSVRGIQEFVVGTGGVGINGFGTIQPNSQVRGPSLGVLQLTLKARATTSASSRSPGRRSRTPAAAPATEARPALKTIGARPLVAGRAPIVQRW